MPFPSDATPEAAVQAAADAAAKISSCGFMVTPEMLEQAAKDVGEGTGLGLSIAYEIVREHDGWIDVASVPGQGSCFSIFLPGVTS